MVMSQRLLVKMILLTVKTQQLVTAQNPLKLKVITNHLVVLKHQKVACVTHHSCIMLRSSGRRQLCQ